VRGLHRLARRHDFAMVGEEAAGMRAHTATLLLSLFLAGCQVYAGGGTLVSDGRTTTVRTGEIDAGTGQGVRTRTTETVVQPGGGGY
jgi:hypothetical protein